MASNTEGLLSSEDFMEQNFVEDDPIETVLERIGCGHLTNTFKDNMITIEQVELLSVEDFHLLGVSTMGVRLRIVQACRNYMKAKAEVQVPECVRTFIDLQKKRVRRTNTTRKDDERKSTRRIYVGWKHMVKGNAYQLISASKGGGQHILDIEKDCNKDQLLSQILGVFLPNGRSVAQNIILEEVHSHLATFSGEALPQMPGGFTVGKYVGGVKTHPIRIYLHTEKKSDQIQDDEDLPELSRPQPRQTVNEQNEEAPDTSVDEDFASTGTPTVSFRRTGNRLRLRRFPIDVPTTTAPSLSLTTTTAPSSSIQTTTAPSLSLPTTTAPSSSVQTTTAPSLSLPTTTAPSSSVQTTAAPSLSLPTTTPETISDNFDGPSDLSLNSILTWWVKKNLSLGEPQIILVCRDFVMKSTTRVVRRPEFNFCQEFQVMFAGEDGEDLGGPKREFLRLLIKDVIDNIFQGSDGNKFFVHDINKLSKCEYEMAGKLAAFSILHGGPGIGVMNEAVFQYMTGRPDLTSLPSIEECVFDEDNRKRLFQIKDSKDQTEYQQALEANNDWCLERGLSLFSYRGIETKENLLKVLITNEIIYSVHTEINQFKDGLQKVGLFLDAMMLSPDVFQPLFCDVSSQPLKFSDLRSIYKVKYSDQGTNYRQQENKAIYCLEAYLADCEGGASGMKLERVLGFWTGAEKLPPLGFSKPLEVSFTCERRLPSAHTCSMELKIFRGYNTPEEFEHDINRAIEWAGGFHLV